MNNKLECHRRLKTMVLMREFEQHVKKLANQGLILGAVHTYTGEEAIALGVCLNLRDTDYAFSTHRGHGHAIAKGCDLNAIMAEMMGKVTGVSKGMGGSMHMFNLNKGLMGGNGIVGGGLSLSLGTAYAAKYKNTDQVTVCFFSEGASNEGWFHEALNMASLWKLPVIFCCENNLFAATTPSYKTLSDPDIYKRAVGYNMPGVPADGNDLDACIAVTKEAVERARAGEGPTLIEFKTYRVEGHCRVINDLPKFRPADVVKYWADHDPIKVYSERLLANGILTQEEIDSIPAEVINELEAATEYAMSCPLPDCEEFLKKVQERYAL